MSALVSERGQCSQFNDMKVDSVRERLNSALRGKADVVELVLVGLLAHGHLLIEDKPGCGKTTLAKALADAVGGEFGRLQCTPDLLPGDVTGFSVFNEKTREFEFRPGPVFADVLLADEINRATPRTQSALLEAMAERQVTYDGVRRPLSAGFFVIATQNPGDQHGTYPLPEAQLDRFAMKLSIGYPERDDELAMLADAVTPTRSSNGATSPSFAQGELALLQSRVASIAVTLPVREYLVRLGEGTRRHPHIELGLSPRGLLILQRCAQAKAFLLGREFVTPDDVQDVAIPVLSVRLATDVSEEGAVIKELLETVPVPSGSEAVQ